MVIITGILKTIKCTVNIQYIIMPRNEMSSTIKERGTLRRVSLLETLQFSYSNENGYWYFQGNCLYYTNKAYCIRAERME